MDIDDNTSSHGTASLSAPPIVFPLPTAARVITDQEQLRLVTL
jgi:hypothetical protein